VIPASRGRWCCLLVPRILLFRPDLSTLRDICPSLRGLRSVLHPSRFLACTAPSTPRPWGSPPPSGFNTGAPTFWSASTVPKTLEGLAHYFSLQESFRCSPGWATALPPYPPSGATFPPSFQFTVDVFPPVLDHNSTLPGTAQSVLIGHSQVLVT